MSTPKKYVPVICTEIRNNGKPCGGHFKSDLSGNFYCMECGIQYQDAFGHAAEESSESMYDEMDKEEATNGLGSLYQDEQSLGGKHDAAINSIEKRLNRNIEAFKKCISTPSSDEIAAKAKLHEKAETDRNAKKVLKSIQRQKKKAKTISVYNSKMSERKKANRIASILAWTKELGPIKAPELRKVLAKSNTPIASREEFRRILKQLAEEGRLKLTSVTEGKMEVTLVTFLH
jgi:hypothetical protein